jgi:hypothetical protein
VRAGTGHAWPPSLAAIVWAVVLTWRRIHFAGSVKLEPRCAGG